MEKLVAAWLVAIVLAGCGLGNDDGGQTALKIVQEFKPTAGATTVAQSVAEKLPGGGWIVSKTSESFYRVSYAPAQGKELLFGVNITKRHVMALNREALAFTNPH
jgi:hypothetical protein